MSWYTRLFGGTEVKNLPRDPTFEGNNADLANTVRALAPAVTIKGV